MIEVRAAAVDDLDAMVALGKRGHAQSANSRYEFDDGRAKLLGLCCINDASKCAFVACVGDEIVGVLLGVEDEYPFVKMRYATDLTLFSEAPGAGRYLIERFSDWALNERGVDQVIMGVTFGGKPAHALYRRMGFSCDGGMFTKQRRQQCQES